MLVFIFLPSRKMIWWLSLPKRVCWSRQGRRYIHFWLSILIFINYTTPIMLCSWGLKESDTTERLNWTELNWCLSLSPFFHVLVEYIARLIIYMSHINLSDEALIRFFSIEKFFVRVCILYLICISVLPGKTDFYT